jgi:hypothetical protein
MSKRIDRERAESGMVFRSGRLVNKEEWNAAHPTATQKAETQKSVDAAVEKMMLEKQAPTQTTPKEVPHRYYCVNCGRYHTQDSKVGKEHTNYYLED